MIAYHNGNICEVLLMNIRVTSSQQRWQRDGYDAEHLEICCDISAGFFTMSLTSWDR